MISILRALGALSVVSLLVVAGCDKTKDLEKRLTAELPSDCKAVVGKAIVVATCTSATAAEKAKLVIKVHCGEMKELKIPGAQVVSQDPKGQKEFRMDNPDDCKFEE